MSVFVTLAGAALFLAVLWFAAHFIKRGLNEESSSEEAERIVGGGSGAFHSTLHDFGGSDGGGD